MDSVSKTTIETVQPSRPSNIAMVARLMLALASLALGLATGCTANPYYRYEPIIIVAPFPPPVPGPRLPPTFPGSPGLPDLGQAHRESP